MYMLMIMYGCLRLLNGNNQDSSRIQSALKASQGCSQGSVLLPGECIRDPANPDLGTFAKTL